MSIVSIVAIIIALTFLTAATWPSIILRLIDKIEEYIEEHERPKV